MFIRPMLLCPLVLGAVVLPSAAVFADDTLPPFDVAAVTEWPTDVAIDVSAVPPGEYAGYEMSLETGGLAAVDVRWRLETPGNPVPLAAPGASPDADELFPPVLTWSGSFHQTYQGGDPLTLIARMDQQGQQLDWTNVTLTLISGTVPPATPPAVADLGVIADGVTTGQGTLTSNGVVWFRFETAAITVADCASLRVDTYGSTLTGGIFLNGNDPEIAVYSADGLLLATSDDVDQVYGDLQGRITFGADEGLRGTPAGDLPAGTYYLAVAGYNTAFDWSQFAVTPDSGVMGPLVVNLTLNEPVVDCDADGRVDLCAVLAGMVDDFDGDLVMDACDDDVDGDGIANSIDACAESPLGSLTNANGGPLGDTDDDCRVTAADFYVMEICLWLSGPEGDPIFDECFDVFDFDRDEDVDLADFANFQRVLDQSE